mmetsp:Transcript_16752/g.29343  ORF Transcript_16752/g.29343 Transcript_16752/m.29343 type:complete len:216 (-) Transcript_16752:77-724(-)
MREVTFFASPGLVVVVGDQSLQVRLLGFNLLHFLLDLHQVSFADALSFVPGLSARAVVCFLTFHACCHRPPGVPILNGEFLRGFAPEPVLANSVLKARREEATLVVFNLLIQTLRAPPVIELAQLAGASTTAESCCSGRADGCGLVIIRDHLRISVENLNVHLVAMFSGLCRLPRWLQGEVQHFDFGLQGSLRVLLWPNGYSTCSQGGGHEENGA